MHLGLLAVLTLPACKGAVEAACLDYLDAWEECRTAYEVGYGSSGDYPHTPADTGQCGQSYADVDDPEQAAYYRCLAAAYRKADCAGMNAFDGMDFSECY